MDYYYKGAKVSILGKSENKYTIVVEDKETADRIGGFLRYDESYLTWFYKTVNAEEVEAVETSPRKRKNI